MAPPRRSAAVCCHSYIIQLYSHRSTYATLRHARSVAAAMNRGRRYSAAAVASSAGCWQNGVPAAAAKFCSAQRRRSSRRCWQRRRQRCMALAAAVAGAVPALAAALRRRAARRRGTCQVRNGAEGQALLLLSEEEPGEEKVHGIHTEKKHSITHESRQRSAARRYEDME